MSYSATQQHDPQKSRPLTSLPRENEMEMIPVTLKRVIILAQIYCVRSIESTYAPVLPQPPGCATPRGKLHGITSSEQIQNKKAIQQWIVYDLNMLQRIGGVVGILTQGLD